MRVLFLMIGLMTVPAFASTENPEGPTLADRLGGYRTISAVVDQFLTNVATDDRINTFFARTDLKKLKKQLADQICEVAKGYYDSSKRNPCKYAGQPMKMAHAGIPIAGIHFDAMIEDLLKAMNKLKVPEREKNELVAVVGQMRKDIVKESSKESAAKAH